MMPTIMYTNSESNHFSGRSSRLKIRCTMYTATISPMTHNSPYHRISRPNREKRVGSTFQVTASNMSIRIDIFNKDNQLFHLIPWVKPQNPIIKNKLRCVSKKSVSLHQLLDPGFFLSRQQVHHRNFDERIGSWLLLHGSTGSGHQHL